METSGLVERSPARVLRLARVGTTPPRGMRPDEIATLMGTLAADASVAGRRDRDRTRIGPLTLSLTRFRKCPQSVTFVQQFKVLRKFGSIY
jgi:hypothetical protein